MRRRSILQLLIGLVWAAATHTTTAQDTSVQAKRFKLSREQIKNLLPAMGAAFATDRITVDGMPVGYMYRETPDRPEDSGWRFFSGDEDQAYIDNSTNTAIYAVNTIANYDPDIIPYVNTPAPCAFEKIPGTHRYKKVDPPNAL
jgi:hypothetical protein